MLKQQLFAFVAFLLASTVSGFWRMECRARSGFAQIDPLVSYDGISEHIHAIHGGNGMFNTMIYNKPPPGPVSF